MMMAATLIKLTTVVTVAAALGPLLLVLQEIAPISGENDAEQRIVGGQNATLGQFPYVVRIEGDVGKVCGGSIVNDRWILTSGDCAKWWNATRKPIYAGAITATDGLPIEIQDVFTQPTKGTSILHGVALLHTTTPITFDEFVQAIEVDLVNFVEENEPLTATGWGSAEPDANPPVPTTVLKYLNAVAGDNAECDNILGPTAPDNYLCAYTSPGATLCVYDSGGPVVSEGKLVAVQTLWTGMCSVPQLLERLTTLETAEFIMAHIYT